MLPVTSLNGLSIGDGKASSVFEKLLSQWSALCDVDIKAQIERWSEEMVGQSGSSMTTPYQFGSSVETRQNKINKKRHSFRLIDKNFYFLDI